MTFNITRLPPSYVKNYILTADMAMTGSISTFFGKGVQTRSMTKAAREKMEKGDWVKTYGEWIENTYLHVKGNTAFVPSITDLYGIDATNAGVYNDTMDLFKKNIQVLPKGAINHMHFFAVLEPYEALKKIRNYQNTREPTTNFFGTFNKWMTSDAQTHLNDSQIKEVQLNPDQYLNLSTRNKADGKFPEVERDLPNSICIDFTTTQFNNHTDTELLNFTGYFVSKDATRSRKSEVNVENTAAWDILNLLGDMQNDAFKYVPLMLRYFWLILTKCREQKYQHIGLRIKSSSMYFLPTDTNKERKKVNLPRKTVLKLLKSLCDKFNEGVGNDKKVTYTIIESMVKKNPNETTSFYTFVTQSVNEFKTAMFENYVSDEDNFNNLKTKYNVYAYDFYGEEDKQDVTEFDGRLSLDKLFKAYYTGWMKTASADATAVEKFALAPDLYIHMGENYRMSSDSALTDLTFFLNNMGNGKINPMTEAVAKKVKRIGHGLVAALDPLTMEMLKEHEIVVEICPVSNALLGYTPNLQQHGAIAMHKSGVKISISGDDPGLFGEDMATYDWFIVLTQWEIREKANDFIVNSINSAGVPEERKKEMLSEITKKWDDNSGVNFFGLDKYIPLNIQ